MICYLLKIDFPDNFNIMFEQQISCQRNLCTKFCIKSQVYIVLWNRYVIYQNIIMMNFKLE